MLLNLKKLFIFLLFFIAILETKGMNLGSSLESQIPSQPAENLTEERLNAENTISKTEAVKNNDSTQIIADKPLADEDKSEKQEKINSKKSRNKRNKNLQKLIALSSLSLFAGCTLFGAYQLYNTPTAVEPFPINSGNSIIRKYIFTMVTGVSEKNFNPNNAFTPIGNGFYTITNPQTNRTFQCGRINLHTVNEWQQLAATVQPHLCKSTYSFKIICLHGGLEAPLRRFGDIASLQAHPMNADSVFQVASRLNALEHRCVYRMQGNQNAGPQWLGNLHQPLQFTPFSRNTGGVQGEEAALSAGPGGIFRMYGPQSINLFERIDPSHLVFNPKCPVIPGGKAIDANKKLFNATKWASNVLICFHEGIEVVTGLEHYKSSNRAENRSELAPIGQIIHQIPNSSFNFKYDNQGQNISEFATSAAQQLLLESYRGTLLASIANGKRKIFLTLVGGGVFYNKIDWILEAINACSDLIKEYGLQIFLVLWGDPNKLTRLQGITTDTLILENNIFCWNGKKHFVNTQDDFNQVNQLFTGFLTPTN